MKICLTKMCFSLLPLMLCSSLFGKSIGDATIKDEVKDTKTKAYHKSALDIEEGSISYDGESIIELGIEVADKITSKPSSKNYKFIFWFDFHVKKPKKEMDLSKVDKCVYVYNKGGNWQASTAAYTGRGKSIKIKILDTLFIENKLKLSVSSEHFAPKTYLSMIITTKSGDLTVDRSDAELFKLK